MNLSVALMIVLFDSKSKLLCCVVLCCVVLCCVVVCCVILCGSKLCCIVLRCNVFYCIFLRRIVLCFEQRNSFQAGPQYFVTHGKFYKSSVAVRWT